MLDAGRLVSRSVSEFVSSVASADEPVPAGGSVAALSGAGSAALLALVCDVLRRKDVPGLDAPWQRAAALQRRLLELVDEDAAAFATFLEDRHDRRAIGRVSRAPIEIARSCGEVFALSQELAGRVEGPLSGDVRAAAHLARAALEAALDLAEQNLSLIADPAERHALRDEISQLRSP